MTEVKTLKTLTVIFENELHSNKISAFRGAVIAKVGRGHASFHNHKGNDFIYQYPSIQYKTFQNKAGLFCVGTGVDEIHHLFGHRSWDIDLLGEPLTLKIHKLDLNSFKLNVWDRPFNYTIRNWLALNAENYRKYQELKSMVDKLQLLEKMLVGNILSFAKGIDWHIEKPIELHITDLVKHRAVKYKGIPLLAFDVKFKCNVFLPNNLGLGKSASHGFGVVKQFKQQP